MTGEELLRRYAAGELDFDHADLRLANLSRAKLIHADLSRAKLIQANLSHANLVCADLRSADLSGADLSGADLSHADLIQATLVDAKLSHAKLVCADLRSADLSHADLSGADLRLADLSGADLSGANLSHADLIQATLVDAKLSHANLSLSLLSPGHAYAQISWPGHGERGRQLSAYHDGQTTRFFCGCFSGSWDELLEFIRDGKTTLRPSRELTASMVERLIQVQIAMHKEVTPCKYDRTLRSYNVTGK